MILSSYFGSKNLSSFEFHRVIDKVVIDEVIVIVFIVSIVTITN